MSDLAKYHGRMVWGSYYTVATAMHLLHEAACQTSPRGVLRNELVADLDRFAHRNVGSIFLKLDDHLTDPLQVATFLAVCRRAASRLHEFGAAIPRDIWSSWRISDGADPARQDMKTEAIVGFIHDLGECISTARHGEP